MDIRDKTVGELEAKKIDELVSRLSSKSKRKVRSNDSYDVDDRHIKSTGAEIICL